MRATPGHPGTGPAGVFLLLALLLLAPGLAGPRPALAAETAAAAAAAVAVGVRTGDHPGHSRLVFDWPGPVDYRVAIADGSVTVTFARPAAINLERLRRPPAQRISAVAAHRGDGETIVTLAVAAGARVSHLRFGNRVVIDVADPAPTAPAPTALAPTATKTAAAKEPAAPAPDAARTAVAVPFAPASRKPTRADPAPIAASAAVVPAKDEAAPALAVASADAGEALRSAVPTPVAAVTAATGAASTPVAAAKPAVAAAKAVSGSFRIGGPTAAVFVRAGQAWIVVPGEQQPAGDLDRLGATVEPSDDGAATVVRFPIGDGVGLSVRPSDRPAGNQRARGAGEWRIAVLPQGTPAPAPAPQVEPDRVDKPPLGLRLVLPVAEPGGPVEVVDPRVGDRLIVLPVPPGAGAIGRDHRYPQLALPATVQGVVVAPLVDDLEVRALERGVEIVRPGGLALSDVPGGARSRALLSDTDGLSRVIPVEDWPVIRPDRFGDERRQRFAAAAAATDPAAQEAARLALARLYLSGGFAVETLGLLQTIEQDRPAAATEPAHRLMRGIARLLMGRIGEAAADLHAPGVDGTDEAALWQGAASVADGRAGAAGRKMLDAGGIAMTYPPGLRRTLPPALAEAALAAGDRDAARRYLDVLSAEAGDADAAGRLAYLRGRLLAADGDAAAALQQFRAAEAGRDRLSAARAAIADVELALEQGELTAAEARDRLDRLRLQWRGDHVEFDLLSRLGRLHLDAGSHADGLRILREAVTAFPDRPETAAVTATMAEAFARLFLDGAADSLPALRAIGLFDEFRELTPAGARGDEMIRRLADRLVAVDLLDRAAELLDDQVRHRLAGEERARVGARLAVIRLLDRDAKAALAALDRSESDALPEDLAGRRRHLRARALIETRQVDAALALLDGDLGRDAELMRTEVFWARRDWRAAAGSLEQLLEIDGVEPQSPLSEDQARSVLNQAVALSLAGNGPALRRLHAAHSEAIKATPYRDAFRLIAGDDGGAEDGVFSVVDRRLEDVEGFQAFLGAWRDRLREGGLNAVN